jgi:hypothetical protein
MPRSTRFEIVRRLLAAVADHLVFEHLTSLRELRRARLHEPDCGRTTIVQSPIRSQRCLWQGTPKGAQQNKAKLEYRGCTRFSQGVQQCHVIADKRRTSLDNPTNKAQPQPSPATIRDNTGASGRETGRAPACNHTSVTCGQPYSAWRWPRPSASAWQPLLWHTANIWRA